MADDDHGAVVLVEHAFEPADGVDVQVIGRLVKQQDVGLGKQGLGEQYAQFEAGSDFAHGGVVQALVDADGFHVVVFGGFGVGVNRVALGHRRPHFGVPHQHHVQHAHVFVGKLVLAQLAQAHAVFNRHFAAGLLQIAAQNLHEGGFARTVCADKAVAVAFAEFDGDVFKQRLRAELHGDVVGGNHGYFPNMQKFKNGADCSTKRGCRLPASPH